jgi:hypothetical protein
MGSPPSTNSPYNLCPHRPSHLALGHPFLYMYSYPTLFFIYLVIVQSLLFPTFTYIIFVTFSDLLFLEKKPLSPLVESFLYILCFLTSSINLEYPTIHVPSIFEFVYFVTPLAQFKHMSSHPPGAISSFTVTATHTSHISPTKGSPGLTTY